MRGCPLLLLSKSILRMLEISGLARSLRDLLKLLIQLNLCRTRFVDGVSTVTRTANSSSRFVLLCANHHNLLFAFFDQDLLLLAFLWICNRASQVDFSDGEFFGCCAVKIKAEAGRCSPHQRGWLLQRMCGHDFFYICIPPLFAQRYRFCHPNPQNCPHSQQSIVTEGEEGCLLTCFMLTNMLCKHLSKIDWLCYSWITQEKAVQL